MANSTYRELIRRAVPLLRLKVVEGSSQGSEQASIARGQGGSSRILKVDIDAIEAIVLDQTDGAVYEGRALRRVGDEAEVAVLGVRPATNREENLQVPKAISA